MKTINDNNRLNWLQQDIEQKFMFKGGKHTRVNNVLSSLIGLILTVMFYAAIMPLSGSRFEKMFTERGLVPYFIVFFSCWAFAILILKWSKLRYQSKSLKHHVVPPEQDFVLSPTTVDLVMRNINQSVDDPKNFVLFNRISIALSNLKNIGRVSDVDEILRSQSELDESSLETSFLLLSGFVWAIPVLGFIGTVLGLSDAIGNFGEVLQNTEDMSAIKSSLTSVTGGLSTAFETTLEALVAALGIQLFIIFRKKSEQEFLDECTEYCSRNVVSKLRVMPFHEESD